MKILITGAAGFIGSHVTDAYIKAGHSVIILDNLSTGVKENINPGARFIKLDILSPQLPKIIKSEKPDIINHHAAHIHVGKSVKDPQFDAKVNILGTINLLQSSLKAKSVKRFIFASTGGAMYGNKKTPFDESMKPQPLSPYGISKRACELYLNFFYEQYGTEYISLRYANVYGPRQNPYGEAGVISIFCENLLSGKQPVINGDGKQTRDYVSVYDVANANLLALSSHQTGEFNIGTGIETDVNKIYGLVAGLMKTEIKAKHGIPRLGEQQTSSLNFNKAAKQLGWKPSVALAEGIEKTVEFFRKK